jgi:hypothetical protein
VSLDPVRALGAYYVATGIWPLLHLRSFMALTGPKRDTWLVQTFGALVAAIGVTLVASRDNDERAATGRVAMATALSLAASEIAFVARGRISPVYLLDSAIELAAAVAIAATTAANSGSSRRPRGRIGRRATA